MSGYGTALTGLDALLSPLRGAGALDRRVPFAHIEPHGRGQ